MLAAVFFLAALAVMKIALTAMLCVLAVSGAIVIALYPLPQGDGLAQLWLSGLVCAVSVPVAWALIFAVAGLVSADALAWSGGLGEGMAALVKPFVAVACLYLAYRAPTLLVAQARMLGLRLDVGAMRSSPGEQRLRSVAHRHGAAYRDRFAGLGAIAARPATAGGGRVAGMAARQTGAMGRTVRRAAASGAVNLAAAGWNERRGEHVARGVEAAGAAVDAAGQAGRAARRGSDWWRRPTRGASGGPSARAAERSPANGGRLSPPRSTDSRLGGSVGDQGRGVARRGSRPPATSARVESSCGGLPASRRVPTARRRATTRSAGPSALLGSRRRVSSTSTSVTAISGTAGDMVTVRLDRAALAGAESYGVPGSLGAVARFTALPRLGRVRVGIEAVHLDRLALEEGLGPSLGGGRGLAKQRGRVRVGPWGGMHQLAQTVHDVAHRLAGQLADHADRTHEHDRAVALDRLELRAHHVVQPQLVPALDQLPSTASPRSAACASNIRSTSSSSGSRVCSSWSISHRICTG